MKQRGGSCPILFRMALRVSFSSLRYQCALEVLDLSTTQLTIGSWLERQLLINYLKEKKKDLFI